MPIKGPGGGGGGGGGGARQIECQCLCNYMQPSPQRQETLWPLLRLIQSLFFVVFRLREVDRYADVLKHPSFKQDAMATISEHIKNSVATGTV